MRIKLLTTLITLAYACFLLGQTIQGIVHDENNQPFEFVNVAIYSIPDSVLITGTVTDSTGYFSLNSDGNKREAYLQVSFMGYETQIISPYSGQVVILNPESTILGELIVKGNLPAIRLSNNGLVATVQNSALSSAGTGNDVLKRLPMLTGDNGAFSVFGKGAAKIYINNREMRDVSELDNLNSSEIRNVEIVTNPGARYDASVKAVIRVKTVRRAGDGFSFDVRSSYWQSQNIDLTEQLNLNYRRNGLDIFGSLSFRQNEWLQDSKVRQITNVDTIWEQTSNLFSEGKTKTLTGITGVNYEISPDHYTGIRYTLSSFPSIRSSSMANSSVLANDEFYDKWDSEEKRDQENKPSHRINAYYNGEFGNLAVDFNTDFFTGEQSSQARVQETSQEFEDRIVTSMNRVKNRMIASKLILTYPVAGGDLSLGGEYTDTRRTDNYDNIEKIVPESNTSIDESNNSFFVEYARMTPIGHIGAGLRYEYVQSDYFSNEKRIDEQSRKYDQWFPNISFATQIKNVGMHLSYTVKTQRPTYRQLSSNVFYMNRFSMQSGNPFLNPSIIHDVTAIGAWNFLQVMVSYKNERNAVIFWTEQMEQDPKVSMIKYRNLEKLPNITAFVSVSPKFGIWTPQATMGIQKQWVSITSNHNTVNLNKPLPIASLNNSFSLPKGFLLTLDMNFQGKGNVQNIYLYENQFIVNVGVTKSFLNDQLDISLKGHDLFNGKKEGNRLYNQQMELFQTNRFDSREVELTVRYKFNSARSKYKGKGAGNEEINRLQWN